MLGTGQIDKVAMRGKKCENQLIQNSTLYINGLSANKIIKSCTKGQMKCSSYFLHLKKQNLSSFVISTVSFVPLRSRLASLDSLFFRKGGEHPWYQT